MNPTPIYLVIGSADYEGDCVEAVYCDKAKAIAKRDELTATRHAFNRYRVEEWIDGETEGKEI